MRWAWWNITRNGLRHRNWRKISMRIDACAGVKKERPVSSLIFVRAFFFFGRVSRNLSFIHRSLARQWLITTFFKAELHLTRTFIRANDTSNSPKVWRRLLAAAVATENCRIPSHRPERDCGFSWATIKDKDSWDFKFLTTLYDWLKKLASDHKSKANCGLYSLTSSSA